MSGPVTEGFELPLGAELIEREEPETSDALAVSLVRKGASDSLIASLVGADDVARIRGLARDAQLGVPRER